MKDMLGWNRISNVKGTRKLVPRNQLVVSVGQPALDIMLEGGLPVGTIFLVEDDEFGGCTSFVLKNYLAEGVMNEHQLLIASLDFQSKNIVYSLPDPLVIPLEKIPRQRYQPRKDKPLRKPREECGSAPNEHFDPPAFGNTFGLGTHRESMFRFMRKIKIDEWCIPEDLSGVNTYEHLYEYIKKSLDDKKYNFNLPSEERTVLRIAIVSIGTGSWTGDIHKFFIKLRLLVRNFLTTCLISIQPRIFDKKDMNRIEYFCDTVIQLETFYEGDDEDEGSEYQGLVILKKSPSINNWTSVVRKTNEDWVFKVRKGSRFIVEKVSEPESKRTRREDDRS